MGATIFKNAILLSIINDNTTKTGFISGQTTKDGIAVSARVMCYHRMSGRLINTTYSDDSGYYRFMGLIAGVKYYVISLDENNNGTQYNAVTQDLITASEVS